DTCCLFDDIDVLEPISLRKEIYSLRDKILQIGRHNRVSLCCTSHLISDYAKTRIVLAESQFITIFPRSGSGYHIARLCKNYLGMNKDQIKRIMNLPSRWVTLHKSF